MKIREITISFLLLICAGLVWLVGDMYKDAKVSAKYGIEIGKQQGVIEANKKTIDEFLTNGYISIIDTQRNEVIYLAPVSTSTYENK